MSSEVARHRSRGAMVRRSTPARITDDRKFPVRVRIRTPMPLGFGLQAAVMHQWLNERVGLGNYAVHGFNDHGSPEASLWYFRDVETAHEFVEQFGCEVLVIEDR